MSEQPISRGDPYDPVRRPNDSTVLRRALSDGIIKPLFKDRALVQWANLVESVKAGPTLSELNAPAVDDRAQRFIDTCRGQILTTAPNAGAWWELARFEVPPRKVGVIRNIDQYAANPQGQASSVIGFWGSPFQTPTLTSANLRWHLRLSTLSPRGYGVWQEGTNRINIPGVPIWDMAPWESMRFPWGDPSQVSIPVPGGHAIRFIVEVVSTTNPEDLGQVAGRLSGFTQAANHVSAAWTTRRGW